MNTLDTIRRLLEFDLKIDRAKLVGTYRWVDSYTPDDIGWFLADVQERLHVHIFPSRISADLLKRIETIEGLVRFVEEQMKTKQKK